MFCGQANDVRLSYSMTFVLITTQTQIVVHQKHYSTKAVVTPEQCAMPDPCRHIGSSPDPCAKGYMYV